MNLEYRTPNNKHHNPLTDEPNMLNYMALAVAILTNKTSNESLDTFNLLEKENK